MHDVADHKYDADGALSKRVAEHLAAEPLLAPLAADAAWIAAHVSYSAERADNGAALRAAEGSRRARARNYVSDADKMAAIGRRGAFRCAEYT